MTDKQRYKEFQDQGLRYEPKDVVARICTIQWEISLN